MHRLNLAQLFGQGAIQDSNFLIIQKKDLLKLTPEIVNTGESLLVAILITALLNFKGTITDSNGNPIVDSNNEPITFDNSDAFEFIRMLGWRPFRIKRNNEEHINHQIIVISYNDATN